MSSSTVSATRKEGPITRRHAADSARSGGGVDVGAPGVEKESEITSSGLGPWISKDPVPNEVPITRRRGTDSTRSAGGTDLGKPPEVAVEKDYEIASRRIASWISRDEGTNPARGTARNPAPPNRKPKKPRWLTIVSILIKNTALIAVLFGFWQTMRWMAVNSGRGVDDFSVISGDFDGKYSEIEKFVKTSLKAIQFQVNAIEGKLEHKISSVRKELNEQIAKEGEELDLKFKALDARYDSFEKFMDEFKSKNLMSMKEFKEFFEEFKNTKKNDVSFDEVIAYARDIVNKEIEKHSADGLGMVDYALASGGGKIVKHSEPYVQSGGLLSRSKISPDSEKMIKPSFGEPGQCFPLKGTRGFVEIRLRTAIILEAVTLEHVAKSVSYDRSSAPKRFRVSGWLQGQDMSEAENGTKVFPLAEFTYDLEKSNAQTFKVDSTSVAPSNFVDTIRLDILSNHGSASHTCIYRLRVHGHEPNSIPTSEAHS